jgi:riboflavin kinase/FMN adenylyltransferase
MQVIRELEACPRPEVGTAVTIGAYDGVHRGHVAVIETVQRLASERGLETAVVTFDRHPAAVVRPESAPLLLTDLEQKLELLEETGVDHTLVVHFDERRSHEPAEDFVNEVLVGCLNVKAVIVGEDFHFGYQRKGNVDLLEEMGRSEGFDVLSLELLGVDGRPASEADRVSSTAIRRALAEGDLERANTMLGRPYEVRGIVAEGDRRGRELGFPTANVSIPADILLPADGIYAGWYERADGTVHGTAMNLGRRPTFYEMAHASLLEAYLLDFDDDLYDEAAKVRFTHRLRPELKFDEIDALVRQIRDDVDETRRVLGLERPA